MTTQMLMVMFTLGTAALALWSYVRWPGAAPATMTGAVLRIALSLVLLNVGAGALDLGVNAAGFLAVLVMVVAIVPVLTYAFLASIWFLKVLADQIRGAV